MMMKWFTPKVVIEVDNDEFRLLIDSLIAFRNQRIANGKASEPIDELLCKLLA